MLNRVLSDKTKLPTACIPGPSGVQNVSAQRQAAKPTESGGLRGIARRLTGAVPGAFNTLNAPHDTKKGAVNIVLYLFLRGQRFMTCAVCAVAFPHDMNH